MACHAPWNRDFIDTHFPAAWVAGAYSAHRENVLLDHEKAQLPATQYMVRNYLLVNELNATLRAEADEKVRLKERLRAIDISSWNARARATRITASNYHSDGVGRDGDHIKRSFVRACPVDDCRGFLSTALKCGLCETYACGDCFAVVGLEREAPHTCDPGALETAKVIKKESRPCPTCGIFISKIDGCDQMFCVQCRTAFSWRTGTIVTGTIHNPHYFDMLRAETATGDIPRQPGDECGGDVANPDHWTTRLHRELRAHGVAHGDLYESIMDIQRDVCSLHRAIVPGLRQKPTDYSDIRMRFLLGAFDEAAFKKKLALREKSIEKVATLIACYTARIQVTTDVVAAFVQRTITFDTFVTNLTQIHATFSGYLDRIKKRFKCKVTEVRAPLWVATERDMASSACSSPSQKRQRVSAS